MQTNIDHLVIGAATLSQGVQYVADKLGVDIPYGGEHSKMGTHNHLMQLGNRIFLEVIAINPDAEPPNRPRWYGLDDPFTHWKINQQPSLLGWVVNTMNIEALMSHASFSLGKAELINRGALSWYFGLPDDGRLLAGGMLPYAIEWQASIHPSTNMADLGCHLSCLEIYHPYPWWLESRLASIDAENLVKLLPLPKNHAPYMVAYINTPVGMMSLSSKEVEL